MIYFDNAATTPCLPVALDAMQKAYQTYGAVYRSAHPYAEATTRAYEEARHQVARFIQADPEEIVFTSGTTDSINRVARDFAEKLIARGDEIAVTVFDHNSNYLPWKALCDRTGAKLHLLQARTLHDLAIPKRPLKLVAFPLITNVSGEALDIKRLTTEAHDVGAIVVVDGAQGVSGLPTCVHDWDVDFFAFSGHKLHGPTGIGVLYGKKEHLKAMTPSSFGGGMNRLEVGTPPVMQAIGLGAICRYWRQYPMEHATFKLIKLSDYAMEKLQSLGATVLGDPKVPRFGIISFLLDGFHPHDVMAELAHRGICLRGGQHCSPLYHDFLKIPASCRISFSVFNTHEEIDVFIDALTDLQQKGLFHHAHL